MQVKSMTETVTDYLRNKIIAGVIVPGEWINETELASRLSISRPPIREALRILEKERLVVSLPRKGTYVTEMSEEDLEEVYQAREMIESYAIDLLKVKKIRDLPGAKSAIVLASDLTFPRSGNREEIAVYLRGFAGFHMELVKGAGNPWLSDFYSSIASHLARYQCMYLNVPGTPAESLKAHREILELIRRGSFAPAKKRLLVHIKRTYEILKSNIAQEARGGQVLNP